MELDAPLCLKQQNEVWAKNFSPLFAIGAVVLFMFSAPREHFWFFVHSLLSVSLFGAYMPWNVGTFSRGIYSKRHPTHGGRWATAEDLDLRLTSYNDRGIHGHILMFVGSIMLIVPSHLFMIEIDLGLIRGLIAWSASLATSAGGAFCVLAGIEERKAREYEKDRVSRYKKGLPEQ